MISEEEKKALQNLWNSVTDVMFNVLYSQEEKDKDTRVVLDLVKPLQRDFEQVDHECSRLEKIDIEKDLEIKKLNNMINLMAEEIDETNRGYNDYCQFKIVCDRKCKSCIKQYFEKKVSENQ